MSKGTAKQITICGHDVKLGDKLKVKYTTGTRMRGGTIEGAVIELWSMETDNHLQGRLSCGWCFHDCDEIISHDTTKEPT